jgi:hypothetical protein
MDLQLACDCSGTSYTASNQHGNGRSRPGHALKKGHREQFFSQQRIRF